MLIVDEVNDFIEQKINVVSVLNKQKDQLNSSFSALRNYIRSEKSNSEKKIRELYKEK